MKKFLRIISRLLLFVISTNVFSMNFLRVLRKTKQNYKKPKKLVKRYCSKIDYLHFRRLKLAVCNNDFGSIKQSINLKNVNAVGDLFGNSLLHHAVSNSTPEICNFLIDLGADVKSRNKVDATPLHLASYGSEFSIIKMLVESGADVNAGQKPWLVKGYIYPLHTAIRYNSDSKALKIVEFLVKHGARIDKKDAYGLIPLNIAAILERLGTVQFLLSKDAKFWQEKQNQEYNKYLFSELQKEQQRLSDNEQLKKISVMQKNTTGDSRSSSQDDAMKQLLISGMAYHVGGYAAKAMHAQDRVVLDHENLIAGYGDTGTSSFDTSSDNLSSISDRGSSSYSDNSSSSSY